MSTRTPAPRPDRDFRIIAGLALLASAALGVTGCSAAGMPSGGHDDASTARSGGSDLEQGVLPEGSTAFDEELPGIGRLDPGLRAAVQRATEDAREDDVHLVVNSGWRSEELQTRMLDEAVSEYGSREEAAQWVATAETSAHVAGDAVDIGGMDSYLWLGQHGADYGLCQTYSNEPWHFEHVPDAATEGCPEQYLDPTDDPRMADPSR